MERLLDGLPDEGLERVLVLGSDEFRPDERAQQPSRETALWRR
jgi:hypothetical protein